jgi:hypothetical protein
MRPMKHLTEPLWEAVFYGEFDGNRRERVLEETIGD